MPGQGTCIHTTTHRIRRKERQLIQTGTHFIRTILGKRRLTIMPHFEANPADFGLEIYINKNAKSNAQK